MNNRDLMKRISNALENGKRGEVDNYELWLKNKGLMLTKTSIDNFRNYIENNPKRIADRQDELELFARLVGYCKTNKSKIYHVVISGIKGIGKTTYIKAAQKLIESIGDNIQFAYFDARRFNETDEYEFLEIHSITRTIEEISPDVLIIDACDSDKDIVLSLQRVMRKFTGLLITVWDSSWWNHYKEDIEEIIETTNVITLDGLSNEDNAKLIDVFLNYISTNELEVESAIKKLIWSYTGGNPLITLSIVIRSFYEMYYNQNESITKDDIIKSAKFLLLDSLDERLSKVSEIQYLILKNLLLTYDHRGLRPKRLVDVINREKATVSYHLKGLIDNRIIKRNKMGKFTFYRISETIMPFIQEKIQRESEFID